MRAARPWCAIALGAALMGLGACAVTGVGVEGDVGYAGVGYADDYWGGPCCYDYGGWGRGYYVGPGRGHDRRPSPPHSHTFRPPPVSRPTPSLPSRHRR
ncbi:MAG TPA: hypothetical protein VHZ53_17820 [Steroidobacteraceae bacterium]|jgi:hypothetical protein|nr:hypothetical protein [Steroidobacteraceae bacterium]